MFCKKITRAQLRNLRAYKDKFRIYIKTWDFFNLLESVFNKYLNSNYSNLLGYKITDKGYFGHTTCLKGFIFDFFHLWVNLPLNMKLTLKRKYSKEYKAAKELVEYLFRFENVKKG